MALPVVPMVAGAVLGAGIEITRRVLKDPPTKEELKRKEMKADTLFIVQPKTALQRAATNVVNTLFF